MLITTTSALERFCRSLEGAPYLAIDTEFIQEKSYYPRLCLIQVAYGDAAAAIDPLSATIDLTPLRKLLYAPTITKVLHASRMDLAIALHRWGAVPAPVFDTQIAASVCGFGQQAGYARLVEALLGIPLDKSAQVTDWSLRPLTSQQITYALGDVTHLCRMYELLREKLVLTGRHAWIRGDMEVLADPARYMVTPSDAWRLVRARRLSRKSLAVLRELAAWREQTAQDRDLPRQWVMSDKPLLEIAQTQPRRPAQLARVRGLKTASRDDGQDILQAVQRALDLPSEQWPAVPARKKPKPSLEATLSLLQTLLQHLCHLHEVAPAMVARRADLYRIATEEAPDVPALQGWRRDLFGDDALALCAGKLALSSRDGQLILHRLSDPDV